MQKTNIQLRQDILPDILSFDKSLLTLERDKKLFEPPSKIKQLSYSEIMHMAPQEIENFEYNKTMFKLRDKQEEEDDDEKNIDELIKENKSDILRWYNANVGLEQIKNEIEEKLQKIVLTLPELQANQKTINEFDDNIQNLLEKIQKMRENCIQLRDNEIDCSKIII